MANNRVLYKERKRKITENKKIEIKKIKNQLNNSYNQQMTNNLMNNRSLLTYFLKFKDSIGEKLVMPKK